MKPEQQEIDRLRREVVRLKGGARYPNKATAFFAKVSFIAKHRGIWPVAWLCTALDVSRSGFHAWLGRSPSARSRTDEALAAKVRASLPLTGPLGEAAKP